MNRVVQLVRTDALALGRFDHTPGWLYFAVRRRSIGALLLLVTLVELESCKRRETAAENPATVTAPALAARIERLVATFLASADDDRSAPALAEARAIFEREGIPGVPRIGDTAAYGFVLINMLGQPPDFRLQFFEELQKAAARQALPQDALAFAIARRRQTEVENGYKSHPPSHPELREQISRLVKADQAARQKAGFDLKRMIETDRKTGGPLKAIFNRYGVPTYDMVGVHAAKDFVVMVQHQAPEFRLAVLPRLKANVDAGQADPATYATVYDRTQRDQGSNQLYGQQLECGSGGALEVAPIDDATTVNRRRAELGLMRLELYAHLVRLHSPDTCQSGGSRK